METTFIMKGKNRRDLMNRKSFEFQESQRRLLKACVSDLNLSKSLRENAAQQLHNLPKQSSRTQIRNRCTFTGRSRGVLSRFRLARQRFRHLAAQGLIPGISSAQW